MELENRTISDLKGITMKNKAFVIAVIVITGSWLTLQLTRIRTQNRIARNRHKQISVIMKGIEKLKESIKSRDGEAVSNGDLNNAIEIGRLEGQIRDLRVENAIAHSQVDKSVFPDLIPILFLVFLSIQIGMLEKKLNLKKEPSVNK